MVSRMIAGLTLWVVAGATAGLLAGLLLAATDVLADPFWMMAVGIVVAAVLWSGRRLVPGSPVRR